MNDTETAPLSPDLIKEAHLVVLQKCPCCQSTNLTHLIKPLFLGLFKQDLTVCVDCGTTLKKKGYQYKLTAITNKENATWLKYGKQTLTTREWVNIANGGLSDKDQREVDIQSFLEKLNAGKVNISVIGGQSSVMFKPFEKPLCVLPNITLKEPRAVRQSSGSYAGPSFRVAKGVSFHVGGFASSSESHQEIRQIDKGTLTVTNMRFIFSGALKGVDISLSKITQIDPYSDGIALHREGREKTQYFLWPKDMVKAKLKNEGREYLEPFTGVTLKCLINGAVRSS